MNNITYFPFKENLSMDTYSREIAIKLRILGIYEIIGGIIGLYLTFTFLISLVDIPELIILFFSIAIALYSFSILCGILILSRKDKQLKYSSINHYLQLINFAFLGYSFKYASGIYLFIGIDFTHLIKFNLNLGLSTWRIMFNNGGNLMEVNINLVSLFILLFINKLKNEIFKNNNYIEAS
ncbi:MAG: hypothetical protein JWN83_200 [Chitinophagaceae bacterium]|nr:hypothetical protein [Chitinophagaceae bacterium]